MDLIELARQFGEEIQKDENYINMRLAEQALDMDDNFQSLMDSFNNDKTEINLEMSKENPNKEKLKNLNLSVEQKYKEIMNNSTMVTYQNTHKEFMDIVKRINAIIIKSAQGESPITADYEECGGSCSSCSGCH